MAPTSVAPWAVRPRPVDGSAALAAAVSRACRCGSVALADAVEEVGGGPLDARVHMAGAVQRRGPGEGARGEDDRSGRGPVHGCLLVALDALAVQVRGVGEQDAALVLGECGAREVAVGLAGDQAVELVALARARRLPEPVLGVPYDQGCGSGTRPAYWMPRSCCSGRSISRQRAGLPGPRRLRQVSRRSGTPDGDGERLTCQYMVLAERKTSEVPPSRALSTVRRIGTDQYSSWPGKTRPR